MGLEFFIRCWREYRHGIIKVKTAGRHLPFLLLKETLFITGVTALRLGTQFALSNFVLIPIRIYEGGV